MSVGPDAIQSDAEVDLPVAFTRLYGQLNFIIILRPGGADSCLVGLARL